MGLRVVFAGTPPFAIPSLDALCQQHEVCAVYTKPDSPSGRGLKLQPSAVKQFTMEHYPDIPILQPLNLKDVDAQEQLQSFHADVMVVIAYGLILPKTVFSFFKYGCINVHASLLPRWRGAAPIQRALLAGDQHTGVTIMQIDQGLDTGAMLHKESYEIQQTDTSQTLHDKLAVLGTTALLKTFDDISLGKVHSTVQDDTLATYAAKITKEEAVINWHDSAEQIHRHIRAFHNWPMAFTILNGQILKIGAAAIASTDTLPGSEGKVLGFSNHGIEVATGRGTLYLQQVQVPGGKMISAKDFMNAKRHEIDINQTVLG